MTDIRFEPLLTGGYTAHIGAGILELAGSEAARLNGGKKAALITDSGVPEEHVRRCLDSLEAAFGRACLVTLPEGEANKTLGGAETIYRRLYEEDITRDDCVVGLGGGVVLDMAGFAAATYLRGVGFISVPTTVIAQTDSAYGGKTGVDFIGGKNHIGVFSHPKSVLCDPELLKTLPERERVCGMGEVVKYGAIAQPELLLSITRKLPGEEIIASCVRIKRDHVIGDEFDRGKRRVLNFGHTFGHAIEAATGYSVPHGQAVAYGMLMAVKVGERLGVTGAGVYESIEKACAAAGLDTDWKCFKEAALPFVSRDKKSDGDSIDFVLLAALGKPVRMKLKKEDYTF